MDLGITRDEALDLLHQYVESESMHKHSLATEAVMRALALRLNADPDQWGLAGLLHDLDIELTHADLSIHGQKAVEILTAKGVQPDMIEAIALHNECSTDQKRSTPFHHALAAGETITGLITATTLVYPDKKLASVKPKSITKRMKEKAFAASVNRDTILECEKTGIPLPEFAEVCLKAMQEIHEPLGL